MLIKVGKLKAFCKTWLLVQEGIKHKMDKLWTLWKRLLKFQ
jgi:hypothetical protein